MIEVIAFAAQGDVMFRRVDRLPADTERLDDGLGLVIAHSETGHHHVMVGQAIRYKTKDPLITYIEAKSDVLDVEHHRPWDTHETLRLLGGIGTVWEVRRQREWIPEGWRQVED